MRARSTTVDPSCERRGASADQGRPRPVTVDLGAAITTCLAALPRIVALRGEIARRLPATDFALLDDLAARIREAEIADGLRKLAPPPSSLPVLAAEAQTLRTRITGDARVAASAGLIPPKVVAAITGLSGYLLLATELRMLVAVFAANAEALAGRSVTTAADLARAEVLADAITGAVSRRDEGPKARRALGRRRADAFTRLFESYDEARRAVAWLRWKQGDADVITPSLYARGRVRKNRPPETQLPPPAADEGAAAPTSAEREPPMNTKSMKQAAGSTTKKSARRHPVRTPKREAEQMALATVVAKADVQRATENPFRRSYGVVLPELRALPVGAIKPINFDVAQGGAIGLRIVESISGRRADMVACGPTVDIVAIDAFGDRSRAMIIADSNWRSAAKPTETLAADQIEGYATRTVLVSAIENLHLNGIDTGIDLAEAKREVGVTNLAASLFGIATGLRGVLARAKGRTAVTEAQLDAADEIATRLHLGLAARGDAASNAADAADIRNRACTLFLQSSDEVLRVMTFLCWRTGDIGKVVPSIYGETNGRRKASAPPPPAAPVTTPSLLSLPAAPLSAAKVTPDSPFLMDELPSDHPFKR